jgi:hypothetical protein
MATKPQRNTFECWRCGYVGAQVRQNMPKPRSRLLQLVQIDHER